MKVRDEKKLTSIPNKKHLQPALNKLGMSDCKGSLSPKLDSEELDEKQTARFRSSVLLSVLPQQRANGNSQHGAVVVHEG